MTYQSSVQRQWGERKGGLAELKIVIHYLFFSCFAFWNPTATFQKEPQNRVTYTHICHDHLDPGLTGVMAAAGMFDLVDSYLLVLFYLGFACVGFFHFVWCLRNVYDLNYYLC